MHDAPVANDVSPCVNIKIVFRGEGIIRIESAQSFAEPDGMLCRRFVSRAFLALEIDSAVIAPARADGVTPAIEVRFDATQYSPSQVLERVGGDPASSSDAVSPLCMRFSRFSSLPQSSATWSTSSRILHDLPLSIVWQTVQHSRLGSTSNRKGEDGTADEDERQYFYRYVLAQGARLRARTFALLRHAAVIRNHSRRVGGIVGLGRRFQLQ